MKTNPVKIDELVEKNKILSNMRLAAKCAGLQVTDIGSGSIQVRNDRLGMDFEISVKPLALS